MNVEAAPIEHTEQKCSCQTACEKMEQVGADRITSKEIIFKFIRVEGGSCHNVM